MAASCKRIRMCWLEAVFKEQINALMLLLWENNDSLAVKKTHVAVKKTNIVNV